MDDHTLYAELKRFLTGPLWVDVLRPRLQDWADAKTAAMRSADTPAALWDARTAAQAAGEALPLIDEALHELRRKLAHSAEPPTMAM